VERFVSSYAPDGVASLVTSNVAILYGALRTTHEAISEKQPLALSSNCVLTWDGRLDNRLELIARLDAALTPDPTDAAIVAAAFERWGADFLKRLVGEWSLALWNPNDRTLILARDPFGTRNLHYLLTNTEIVWSTILDPLVLLPGRRFTIDEEYLAGWFASFPAAERTPYAEIRSVPASSSVLIRNGIASIREYWTFGRSSKIRYRKDRDYEEHFRNVFGEAVRRRLRSNGPVTAELSGGMDSSSIVCVADMLVARGESAQVNTVSYYDDSEPNWNERPYFSLVEQQRHRDGLHIAISSETNYRIEVDEECFAPTPASAVLPSAAVRQFKTYLFNGGSRVVLSGTGGDEIMGGVPTLIPELADLLVRGHFIKFLQKALESALCERRPMIHVLWRLCSEFLPARIFERRGGRSIPWLAPEFVRHHRAALSGYQRRLQVFGPLPSVQEYVRAFASLRRQLNCSTPARRPSYEKRYPFLDRDLAEFVCSIPREQLVRPNQRRSLMRRALRGIVPEAILERRRKAYVSRGPLITLGENLARMFAQRSTMLTGNVGWLNPDRLVRITQNAHQGKEVPILPILRTLMTEFWLRALERQALLGSKIMFRADVRSENPQSTLFRDAHRSISAS
jgi:asparagine synthase (glutamine-hydrolysing)